MHAAVHAHQDGEGKASKRAQAQRKEAGKWSPSGERGSESGSREKARHRVAVQTDENPTDQSDRVNDWWILRPLAQAHYSDVGACVWRRSFGKHWSDDARGPVKGIDGGSSRRRERRSSKETNLDARKRERHVTPDHMSA